MQNLWKLSLLLISVFAFADDKIGIVILHTNDVHGHVWPWKDTAGNTVGGMAAQAYAVQQIRAENDKNGAVTLVLSGGDVNTGVPESDEFDAEPDFVGMNGIGYDAMVAGNHDFDKGVEVLLRQKALATFPILTANIGFADQRAKTLAEPYRIITKNNIRFGILGLTTNALKTLILPKHSDKLSVRNPIEVAKQYLPEMKKKSDVIIALTHLGVQGFDAKHKKSKVYPDDIQLANANPEIDFVIGGHSHTLLKDGVKEGNTLIAQAGEWGSHLGKVTGEWDTKTKKVSKKKAEMVAIAPSLGENKGLAKKLDVYLEKSKKVFDEVIGKTDVFLDGNRETTRHKESNLGNLICDALREAAKADVAFFNGGGIRDSIQKGDIRYRDILKAFPFRNRLTTMKLTGKQLRRTLEEGSTNSTQTGSFLQVSGLSYEIDKGKIGAVKVAGQPLENTKIYTVATNDFVATGGDGFKALLEAKKTAKFDDLTVEKALIAHIRGKKTLASTTEGRILIK